VADAIARKHVGQALGAGHLWHRCSPRSPGLGHRPKSWETKKNLRAGLATPGFGIFRFAEFRDDGYSGSNFIATPLMQ
jgi:hypothetical protein